MDDLLWPHFQPLWRDLVAASSTNILVAGGYHEILAYISDRFQYLEEFREEDGDRAYSGPWQLFLRDIDPSATERSMRGGSAKGEERNAWWKPVNFDAWETDKVASNWTERNDNLPQFEKLMVVTNSTDGSRWLSLNGYFNWTQKPPADREANEVERRELWYLCHAYFVKSDSAPAFLQWAKGVDFWGRCLTGLSFLSIDLPH